MVYRSNSKKHHTTPKKYCKNCNRSFRSYDPHCFQCGSRLSEIGAVLGAVGAAIATGGTSLLIPVVSAGFGALIGSYQDDSNKKEQRRNHRSNRRSNYRR